MTRTGRATSGGNATVACTECGASDAIRIEMTLPDGTEVHFCSCHRCEHRWWDNGSRRLDLSVVLDKARPTGS